MFIALFAPVLDRSEEMNRRQGAGLGIGALLTLPIALATAPCELPSIGAVLAVITLGLLRTAVGFTFYYSLIDQIGEGRGALAYYLTPALALLYGTLLLGESITFAAIVGLVLIVVGAEITLREAKTRRPRGETKTRPETQPPFH